MRAGRGMELWMLRLPGLGSRCGRTQGTSEQNEGLRLVWFVSAVCTEPRNTLRTDVVCTNGISRATNGRHARSPRSLKLTLAKFQGARTNTTALIVFPDRASGQVELLGVAQLGHGLWQLTEASQGCRGAAGWWPGGAAWCGCSCWRRALSCCRDSESARRTGSWTNRVPVCSHHVGDAAQTNQGRHAGSRQVIGLTWALAPLTKAVSSDQRQEWASGREWQWQWQWHSPATSQWPWPRPQAARSAPTQACMHPATTPASRQPTGAWAVQQFQSRSRGSIP